MAVISVPKDLDRVNKSLEWFGQSTDCLRDLCDVVLLPRVNNMLIVILWAVPRRTAGLCLSPCELILCYCCKLNNMIYGINFVNICMSDILAYVECLVCHCIALRWGVTQVGKFHYWALLTLSREHIF